MRYLHLRFLRSVMKTIVGVLVICQVVLGQTLDSRQITVRQGTNMALALAPDAKSLALDLQGTIYTIPSQGGTAQALTDGMGDDRQPSWSPDGKRILFQSYRGGGFHAWSVDRGGKNLRQHTSGTFDHREPVYTPDGKSILCSSDRSGNYDIWRVDLASGQAHTLTTGPANEYGPSPSPSGDTIAYASDRPDAMGVYLRLPDGREKLLVSTGENTPAAPSWSADGRSLSYQLLKGVETRLMKVDVGSGAVVSMSQADEDVFPFRAAWSRADVLYYTADGLIKKRGGKDSVVSQVPFAVTLTVSTPRYEPRKYDFDGPGSRTVKGIRCPVVSPDGKKVAFVALGDLWLLKIGDQEPQRLTDDAYYENDPAWSPDGNRLLFSADRSGNMDLYVMDMGTKQADRLTDTPEDEFQGAWLADGKKITFLKQGLRNTLGTGTLLHIMDLANKSARTVYKPMFQPGQPTWAPSGKRIMLAALDAYSTRYREGVSKFLVVDAENGKSTGMESPFPNQTMAMRYRNGPLWSPDGTKVAYVKDALLWVVDVTEEGTFTGAPRALTDELAESPSWTGDSKYLVYLATDHLRKVNVDDAAKTDIPMRLNWQNASATGKTVIHAGRLFDGKQETLQSNVDLVVEGSRITAIHPHRTDYPPEYRRIDASDLTVMPGLFDMHAHLDAQYGEKIGRIWLAYGITAVREPGSDPYDALEMREAWQSGKRPGPFHFLTGALTDGQRIYYNMATAINSEAQLALELDRARRLDYDLIKTYVRMPDEWQKTITEFAHRHGMTVSSHEIFPAARYGVDAVEHLSATSRRGYSPKLSSKGINYDDVVQIISKSGMVITPTLALQGGFWNRIVQDSSIFFTLQFTALYPEYYRRAMLTTASGMRSRPITTILNYPNTGASTKRLLDQGARITSGTDSPIMPYGTSLHVELWSYVESGFTPFQALQTATINAARALHVDQELGSLEVGKIANISIVNGNPLKNIEDTAKVRFVLVNGKVYTLSQLLETP